MPSRNEALLKEVEAAGLWFHAMKTRPISVKRLEKAETVQTLEGSEQVPAGAYLCRGEAGDIWPQTEERLTAKYDMTDDIDEQGWRPLRSQAQCRGCHGRPSATLVPGAGEMGAPDGKGRRFLGEELRGPRQ